MTRLNFLILNVLIFSNDHSEGAKVCNCNDLEGTQLRSMVALRAIIINWGVFSMSRVVH